MSSQPPFGKMMTIREVAEMFMVHPCTVHRWCSQRKLTSHKVGKFVLVPAAEVERLMTQGERPRAEVA